MSPNVRHRAVACALAVTLGTWGASVSAQFRPPPATDAERLTYAGDDLRVEAAVAMGQARKERAQEYYRRALELYEKALLADPHALEAGVGFGLCATALNDNERAARVLGPLVKAHPEATELAFHLGLALFKLRRYPEALPLLERFREDTDPSHLVVHYYLGYFYLSWGRADDAVASLRRYLALRPVQVASNDAQIHELIGRAHLVARRPVEARAAFREAQAGRPEVLSVQMGLASVLELESRLAEARTLLEGLAARFPKSPEPKERLGRLALVNKDLARADAWVAELLHLDAGPGAQLLLGDVRLAERRYPEAEAALRQAMKLAPKQLSIQVSLARALQAQGQSEEAVSLLENASRVGGNSVEVLAALGSVYRRAGRYQRAIDVHRKVVELAPTLARGQMLLGADYSVTGQWDSAVEAYSAALSLEPENPQARHWLALALTHRARLRVEAGHAQDGVRDLRRAFDLEPAVLVGRNLGAALMTVREPEEARSVLEQVVQLAGSGWQEQVLLGYTLLALGANAEALAAFESAGKRTTEPGAVSEIYAGWALAKLELGEFDTAVTQLEEMGPSARTAELTRANLPLALLRRAFERLHRGEVDNAGKDLEAVRRLGPQSPDVQGLWALAQALWAVEQRDFERAQKELRRATSGKVGWLEPGGVALLESYVAYRQGQMSNARRQLQQGKRRLSAAAAEWALSLGRAIDRREGELDYAQGALGPAFKALKAAESADPLNPYVQHNLACLDYRQERHAEAIQKWEEVVTRVPEAALNLGIDAHGHRHDFARAVEYYARYLNSSGGRSGPYRDGQVREWKERLQSLYGLDEPRRDERKRSDSKAEGTP